MKMTNQKLFITDFDGTLLNDEKSIDAVDLQSLEQLKSNGVVTAVATGRSLFSYNRAMGTMGIGDGNKSLPVDYLIFSTGAGIMDLNSGQIIFEQLIPPHKSNLVIQYLTDRKIDFMVQQAIPEMHRFSFKSFGGENPDFFRRIKLYKQFAEPVPNDYVCDHSVTQILVILPQNTGMKMVEKIRADQPGFSVIQATSPLDHDSVWIEIFHSSVSKSSAAATLARLLGISQDYVFSVGNDYNDQDLLDWSAQGYLVKNGPEILKNKYPVVASNNCCGVTDAAFKAGLIPSNNR